MNNKSAASQSACPIHGNCNLSLGLIFTRARTITTMKFLQSEYSSLRLAIESAGEEYKAFLFVKRRGNLFVEHKAVSVPFAFHRKKVTSINASHRFEEQVHYVVLQPVKSGLLESWDEVLLLFKQWLADQSFRA